MSCFASHFHKTSEKFEIISSIFSRDFILLWHSSNMWPSPSPLIFYSQFFRASFMTDAHLLLSPAISSFMADDISERVLGMRFICRFSYAFPEFENHYNILLQNFLCTRASVPNWVIFTGLFTVMSRDGRLRHALNISICWSIPFIFAGFLE